MKNHIIPMGVPAAAWALAALSAALACAAPAAAQACDATTATATTFADATSTVALGSCIAIDGVAVGRLLVEDGRARYRSEQRENDPSSTGAILGFYSDGDIGPPRHVRVVGTLSDCATAESAFRATLPAESIYFPQGFCHYFKGRFVLARAVTLGEPANFVRVGRNAAPPELGNLAPLADGDVRQQMLRAAARLLDAIRGGDRATVAVMHGGGPSGTRRAEDSASVVDLLFDDGQSPFAPLRAAGPVVIEIFGWRAPLWADAEWHAARDRTGTAQAIACFSRHANAAAMWPIDSKDADNLATRPYACTLIILSGTGADSPASFDTMQAQQGVAEPQ